MALRPDPLLAEAVLEFWLADAAGDPERARARASTWFGGSPDLDAEIRRRFGALALAAASGELDAWLESPREALALVILLDQFPRNLWRGSGEAFDLDARALAAARRAVAAGHLTALAPVEASFLLLPFEHSEGLAAQRECVARFQELVRGADPAWRPLLEGYLDFARDHLAIVERFGRFPHRNAALGRPSTPEEVAYLALGAPAFGQSRR